jgi:hypothetical protein
MTSVMATESDVFGRFTGEIDVSVEIENGDDWLCCALIHLGFILEGKVSCEWLWRWTMVPGIGSAFGALGLIEELKSPCGYRGFWI